MVLKLLTPKATEMLTFFGKVAIVIGLRIQSSMGMNAESTKIKISIIYSLQGNQKKFKQPGNKEN